MLFLAYYKALPPVVLVVICCIAICVFVPLIEKAVNAVFRG